MRLEDFRANQWSLRPCCMVAAYRVAHFCSVWRKKNVLNNLWAAPVLLIYRGCDDWPSFHYSPWLCRRDQ